MAFGIQDSAGSDDEVMNEINMTPMVDVMLVLLIIFIVTIPVMKHSTNIALPQASSQPIDAKPQTARLAVNAQGQYFWNEAKLSDAELITQLQTMAHKTPPTELHISADKDVRYERVAQAMAAAQLAGVQKIGFVTEPKK